MNDTEDQDDKLSYYLNEFTRVGLHLKSLLDNNAITITKTENVMHPEPKVQRPGDSHSHMKLYFDSEYEPIVNHLKKFDVWHRK